MTPPKSRHKQRIDVPVRVVASSRPVVSEPIVAEAPVTPTPIKAPAKKFENPLKSFTTRPEHERRRLMWVLVAGTAGLIVVGWISLWGWEMSGGQKTSSLFSRIRNVLSTISVTTPTTSAAEKEIRQLDTEVFPKFK
jgi:hypothetical protein